MGKERLVLWIIEAALDITKYALLGFVLMLPALKAGEFKELTALMLFVPLPFFLVGFSRSWIFAVLAACGMTALAGCYVALIEGWPAAPVGVLVAGGVLAFTGALVSLWMRRGVKPDSALSLAVITVMLLLTAGGALTNAVYGPASPQAVLVPKAEQWMQTRLDAMLRIQNNPEERKQTWLTQAMDRIFGQTDDEKQVQEQIEFIKGAAEYLKERISGLIFAGLGLLAALAGFISIKAGRLILLRFGAQPADFAPMVQWRFMRFWTWVMIAGITGINVQSGSLAPSFQRAGLGLMVVASVAGITGGTALATYMMHQFLKSTSLTGLLAAMMVITLVFFLFPNIAMSVLALAGLGDSWMNFRRFVPSENGKPADQINTADSGRNSGPADQGGSTS